MSKSFTITILAIFIAFSIYMAQGLFYWQNIAFLQYENTNFLYAHIGEINYTYAKSNSEYAQVICNAYPAYEQVNVNRRMVTNANGSQTRWTDIGIYCEGIDPSHPRAGEINIKMDLK